MNHAMAFQKTYHDWFARIAGWLPREWQANLAANDIRDNHLIRIPTGMGKTEGVLCAWLYHAAEQQRRNWPRRLVWCLPMRVLVEQTADRPVQITRWQEAAVPTIRIQLNDDILLLCQKLKFSRDPLVVRDARGGVVGRLMTS